MRETGFKFQPFYVLFLAASFAGLLYVALRDIYSDASFDWIGFTGFILLPAIAELYVVTMVIKMLLGIPAIVLTPDGLVNNVSKVTIDWSNVANLRLEGSWKPFLAIDLKDTGKFYADIPNPLKRYSLRLLNLVSPGDISIYLAFVSGNEQEVFASSTAYWNKFYGEE